MQIQSITSIESQSKTNLSPTKMEENTKPESANFAATKLTSTHDLDMYFKPRPNVHFCNHAVAVVAATAAIVAAASSVIEASKRGRPIDNFKEVKLENADVSGLDVSQLMAIRSRAIETNLNDKE